MDKFFLIAFDNTLVPVQTLQFHQNIKNLFTDGYIKAWWHYLPSVYIIKTSSVESVNNIYNKVFSAIPGQNILVIEVTGQNIQGWLPKAAWDWLNTGGLS